MIARPLCQRPGCACQAECWLCCGAPVSVKLWFRTGQPAIYARACEQHQTRLELVA